MKMTKNVFRRIYMCPYRFGTLHENKIISTYDTANVTTKYNLHLIDFYTIYV
jgi:hypothetical protein